MRPPALIAITDTERGSCDLWLEQLERVLVVAAPHSVQVMLRDRQLTARQRHAFGSRLRALTTRHAQTLSINDRLDLAALLQADAVHLSESSVSVADARAFASQQGFAWSISRASHDPDDATRTEADALLLAPIAAARKGRPALGTEGLRQARAALGERPATAGICRLYALGGITGSNAASCLDAGADGVAVIGTLLEPEGPHALVESLGIRR